jgi:hypothetical protein
MNKRPPAAGSEEPELNNERDIPTEDGGAEAAPARGAEADVEGRHAGAAPRETVAGRESVAGEEDPGAALDTEPDAPDAGR